MSFVLDVEQLAGIYGTPAQASIVKEIDYLDDVYRPFVEKAPFVALATVSEDGIDCSPRGDQPGFVRVQDQKTLIMPDRRGNNRIDSLANIVRDPRTSFMFLIPGSNTVLRVNGQARVSIDPELLASFEVEGKVPRSAIVLTIDKVYFQCARAVMRAGLWDIDTHIDPKSLPTAGEMLSNLSEGTVGGKAYDDGWGKRAKETMW